MCSLKIWSWALLKCVCFLLLLDAVIHIKKNPACSPEGNSLLPICICSSATTCMIMFLLYFIFTVCAVMSYPGAILRRSSEMLDIVFDPIKRWKIHFLFCATCEAAVFGARRWNPS